MKLNVAKIQRFSTHDGPGLRTVVFLKGCPLSCVWCHNPETQSVKRQIFFYERSCIGCKACANACEGGAHIFSVCSHTFDVSKCTGCMKCADACPAGAIEKTSSEMSAEAIISAVKRDIPFYGEKGGMTLSGGEPMLDPEACISLLSAAKECGISTAVETCGYFPRKYAAPLAKAADFLLWDLKDGNSPRHKANTGKGNEMIIENLIEADKYANHITVRCIMVKGQNTDDSNFDAVAKVVSRLSHCDGVELIPYHAYAGSKAKQLGYRDNGVKEWIPTDEDMSHYRTVLQSKGCNMI